MAKPAANVTNKQAPMASEARKAYGVNKRNPGRVKAAKTQMAMNRQRRSLPNGENY